MLKLDLPILHLLSVPLDELIITGMPLQKILCFIFKHGQGATAKANHGCIIKNRVLDWQYGSSIFSEAT